MFTDHRSRMFPLFAIALLFEIRFPKESLNVHLCHAKMDILDHQPFVHSYFYYFTRTNILSKFQLKIWMRSTRFLLSSR